MTFVCVGSPQMERYEGNLEAEACEEKYHGQYLKCASVYAGCHVIEIKRPGSPVEKRYSVQHETAREQRAEYVLRTCFSRVMFVFVECHEACHRYGCQFKTDEEHHEMSRTDHEIHSKECRQGQYVKFASLELGVFFPEPGIRLQEYQQRADGKDAFDDYV